MSANKVVITGSEAAAVAAALARTGFIPVYPITPATEIPETLARLVARGELKDCEFMTAESEHSAMSAAIGASQQGARTFTATSSQGLLYMAEVLHWASGARLPIVMANVNRALGPPWNIWADQTDSLSQRDAGWVQIYCESNQEVFDSVLQGFRIAERIYFPVMICLDGFILSHTKEDVELATQEQVDFFLPKIKIPHALDCADPRSIGASGTADSYFQFKTALAGDFNDSLPHIKEVFEEFKDIFGREYFLLTEYRMEDADVALVTTGSIGGPAEEAVDILREKGIKAGVVKIRVFRPFPTQDIKAVLNNVKKVVVLDVDTKEIVLDEIKKAIYPESTPVFGYTVGVGGVVTSSGFIAGLVEEANSFDLPKDSHSIWRAEKEYIYSVQDVPASEDPVSLIQPGHRACAGCTASLVMARVLEVMGPRTEIALPACCWSIIAGPNPYTPVGVPLLHSPFAAAAAVASGIKRASLRNGEDITTIAFAGDGGTFDIGLQALSGASERGEDIIFICYDNEFYGNTGGQRSSATPYGAATETTPFPAFKIQPKKNIMKIIAAHGVPYAATASIYHTDDLIKKLRKAKNYKGKGLRFLHILAPCNPGWGFSPHESLKMACLAVEAKIFPLIEYENGKWKITYRPEKAIDIRRYLKPQKRFSHLTEIDIDIIRKGAENYWEELEKL